MMSGIQFTPRLRTVLGTARQESQRLRHEYIGTEHILLALLHEADGVTADVFRTLDIAPEQIRQTLEGTVRPGPAGSAVGPDQPYTSRSKKVLELTFDEATRVGLAFADTEHLLVALCAEEKGIAAQVLASAGLTADIARAQIDRLAGAPPEPPPAATHTAQIVAVAIELRLADGSVRRADFQSVAAAVQFLASEQ
jgi:ATP-dependent Clp protease ATP-binding subunit ClpC